MRYTKIAIILFLTVFSNLSSQIPASDVVRVDNDEIQTFRGISGKWVILKNYKESFSTLLNEFGADKKVFHLINDLAMNAKIDQRTPYFMPFGEEYLKNLLARGMGRKFIKNDPRDFVLPVSTKYYHVTSKMGRRWNIMHAGLDIACPSGSPVVAAADGVVTESSFYGSYGNAIIIRHNNLNNVISIYGHNSVLLVKEGEKVIKGQIIALSGNTGHSTGPHLHFEVRYDTVILNPEHYLPGMINPETAIVAFENLQDFGIQ